jgi:nicotinamidase-related amidase
MPGSSIIKKDCTAFVVIDVQEKLLPFISEKERVVENIVKLIEFAKKLSMPMVWTEQYPKGLGATVDPIKSAMQDYKPLEKVAFSCFGAEGFADALRKHGAKTLALVGIETHVCVAQTALDGIDAGYRVCVVKDAVSSRTQENKQVGIDRVRERGGIITSTEAIMFEILEKAGTPEFKAVMPLLK